METTLASSPGREVSRAAMNAANDQASVLWGRGGREPAASEQNSTWRQLVLGDAARRLESDTSLAA